MFNEKEIKTYLLIRRNAKINKVITLVFIIFCFISPFIGWAPLEIPIENMPLIGLIFGAQFFLVNTPEYGASEACDLIEKAIHRDPNSLILYSKVKNCREVENA